jgi:hypothetical protein
MRGSEFSCTLQTETASRGTYSFELKAIHMSISNINTSPCQSRTTQTSDSRICRLDPTGSPISSGIGPAISPFPSSASDCTEKREEELVHEHVGTSSKKYESLRRRYSYKKSASRPTPGNMDPCQGDDEYFVCRKGGRLIVFGFGASTDAIVSHGMA